MRWYNFKKSLRLKLSMVINSVRGKSKKTFKIGSFLIYLKDNWNNQDWIAKNHELVDKAL